MSEQSFQAWAEAIGHQIIESVKCGIDGVCQTCAGAIAGRKGGRHCHGRRWCEKHKQYASCYTEEQYCCEEGWSEALWKDAKKQEEEKKAIN